MKNLFRRRKPFERELELSKELGYETGQPTTTSLGANKERDSELDYITFRPKITTDPVEGIDSELGSRIRKLFEEVGLAVHSEGYLYGPLRWYFSVFPLKPVDGFCIVQIIENGANAQSIYVRAEYRGSNFVNALLSNGGLYKGEFNTKWLRDQLLEAKKLLKLDDPSPS